MNQQIEVSDWLLKHGSETLQDLQKRINPNYKLLPDFAYEIFLDNYSDEALKTLRESVMKSLNINFEEIELFFNKEYVKLVLGNKVFYPEFKGDEDV